MTVTISSTYSASTESPLLAEDTVDGAVDYIGRPAIRSRYGQWKSAAFIIGVEVAERISYYGIASNLMSYLTGPLGQSTAAAAANINAWSGIASLLPLLGAAIADSFLGRYRTIVAASLIYIMGLGFLTLSAMIPSVSHLGCHQTLKSTPDCPRQLQVILFFASLYLVAIGQGGHKPCVQAFGADQFDGQNPEESIAKSSFFNWWYFIICLGPLLSVSFINYIQDNLDWSIGFGIPCVLMAIALVVFLLGNVTYRYVLKSEENSSLRRMAKVFAGAARNWNISSSALNIEEEARGILPQSGTQHFRFLCKAMLAPDGSKGIGNACSIGDIEDTRAVLRLFPIWALCLIYGIVFAQLSTLFTKQGITMDRSLGSGFIVPAASLQSFVTLFTIIFVPIYDRIFVPLARQITGKPTGITMLQRIGTGMFISMTAMVVAAFVEIKRLDTALEHDLIDSPNATVPLGLWWLVPQYALFGIADVFTMIGLQEFFYSQVPSDLRSVGISLYMSIFGVGSLLSSFLVSAISKATSGVGRGGWFNDNLNRAHLDYFYWLLAGLSAMQLALFIYFEKCYVYNRQGHKLPYTG